MTKFNIGDILANYSGGLDKPAYEVVDNTDGVYRLKQIPSGTYFTWKYVIVEAYNALYIAPVIPNGTVVCYTPESLTCTVRGVKGPDYILERHDGGRTFLSSRVVAGACEVSTDPCVGVLCREYECDGYDLYSQKCVGGVCVRNELVQSNSPTCGYVAPPPDPCAGVTCPNGCWGTSLYSQRCVDGRCVKGALIKSNAPECGYVAPSLPKAIIEYSYTRPTSAKPLDRLLGYVKVKNIGGQANSLGDFTVKWINADTGVQFATTQNLGVIAPGSSTGNNIYINMPDIARPLRVLAKVYYKGTLHDSKESTVAYTAPPAPVTPAKGQLLNVVLPTSKIHGSTAKITATIKNIGGTTRKFKITLYRVAAPGVYITQTPGYTIGPGESVNTEISWDAPTSGTSVRYSLKCVNVDDFSLDDHRNFDVALTAPFVCAEGEVRSPETCWDDTTIHGEVCRDNTWVPSGETCPPKPECTEGDKKPGHVCSGGKWVPVGTPPPPECTEGDKKPGYVCSGGKWISTMPGPVHGEPSTIEAPEIIPGIKPPRIPLLTPELAKIPLLPGWVIRDADGRIVAGRAPDTIEFQEIVPGIKPPRVPQLIPSLEKFPLLPGWTIRNREGTVVAHGAPLPTIGTEEP